MTKSTPKVSFLVPDINSPVLGPVTVLTRTLEPHFPVQVVGPDFGHGVCPMYRGAYDYTVVATPRMYRFPEYFAESRKLGAAIEGDIIIAVKAYASTVGVALREKRRRNARVMVYLDEWDGALMKMRPPLNRVTTWLRNLHHPLDAAHHPWVERWLARVDQVLSTSTWLQGTFGGEIVHMGVDTDFFQPVAPAQVEALRKEHGLSGKKCIVFGGVVRPHKGIEWMLDALVELGNPAYRLVVVGPVNSHVKALQAHSAYQSYIRPLGAQPKELMPAFLSLADLIVLPLNDNLLAQSQTPCKIFEAMAMARPVIASKVADLPLILDGCGQLVPPGDVGALAGEIQRIFGDPEAARRMGAAAREKCIREYSREVTEKKLVEVVNRVWKRGEG